jgi:hypothetical protein
VVDWWLTVVKLVVALVGGWNGSCGRGGRGKKENGNRGKTGFLRFLDLIFDATILFDSFTYI